MGIMNNCPWDDIHLCRRNWVWHMVIFRLSSGHRDGFDYTFLLLDCGLYTDIATRREWRRQSDVYAWYHQNSCIGLCIVKAGSSKMRGTYETLVFNIVSTTVVIGSRYYEFEMSGITIAYLASYRSDYKKNLSQRSEYGTICLYIVKNTDWNNVLGCRQSLS